MDNWQLSDHRWWYNFKIKDKNKIMSYFQFKNIRIAAVGAAVPKNRITVDSFKAEYGDEMGDKFKESTGIKEFRRSIKYQTASDFGYTAANLILEKKSIDRKEIGALVFVAHSTDYRRPATACVLHKRLGLDKNCAAFDVNLGCSAFIYGVQIASSLMSCSDMKYALLVVGETMTKITYPGDKAVSMLFGDGGGAILLEKTDNVHDEIKAMLKTDGTGYKAIIAPAGGFRNMDATHDVFVWKDGNPRTLYNTIMKGDDVFAFTISDVPRTIKEFLAKTNTDANDYDCLAFHQANQFISKQLARKLKVDPCKLPICLDRYGNTSAAAIPLTICDAYGEDDLGKNINFLMSGFGVGLSWGVGSAIINTNDIYPVVETDEYFEEGVINSPEDYYKE